MHYTHGEKKNKEALLEHIEKLKSVLNKINHEDFEQEETIALSGRLDQLICEYMQQKE